MDFEWEKLVNGESEIDADDINALADGIIGNKKEIKAIKDIMDNGGTIPEYLTNFFKEIPKGMTMDDLYGEEYYGYYIEPTKSVHEPISKNSSFDILVVSDGFYVNDETNIEEYNEFQTRFVWDGFNYRIQTRHGTDGYWSDWQDAFATPQYVKEQIAKIPTGGGGETWEILQNKEITEEDGELENLVVGFPEDYKKFIVKLERTAPTASSNTIIYPCVITTDDKSRSITFWDYYDGTNASHYELQFSTIKTSEKTVVKMEGYGYSSNQKPIGKPQALFTSGWIDGNKNGYTIKKWEKVNFKTKLNVGSKYTVWGCK